MTHKLKTWTIVLTITSVLLNLGPALFYVIKGLISADLITEKVGLVTTVFIVLILTAISIVNKIALKSRLWILLIGLYVCLKSIMTPIIIIGVCQVVDELIVAPVARKTRQRYIINKEIDKRS